MRHNYKMYEIAIKKLIHRHMTLIDKNAYLRFIKNKTINLIIKNNIDDERNRVR